MHSGQNPPTRKAIATLAFADFEIDPARGELRKHGLRIRIQEQPLRLLLILLESPGELITRDQLRERIWPADTFVEFEHSLNTSVNKLRRALNDSAGQPRYIETVPRRGYRFIGELREPPHQIQHSMSASSEKSGQRGWSWAAAFTSLCW